MIYVITVYSVDCVAITLFFFVVCSTLGWRLGLQTVTGSAVSLFFLGLFYRSASLYHPQRRAILHLKDMSKRKGKDKNKIESKPPYFDFNTLSMRSFQVILVASALASTGTLAPVFFLVSILSIITKYLYDMWGEIGLCGKEDNFSVYFILVEFC